MLLFLLFLLPACLGVYWYTQKLNNIVPMILSGTVSALLCCGIKMIFFFSHRVINYSFLENFLNILFFQALLPVLVLYGIFMLIDHDEMEFKVAAFLPVLISFYAIFLPCIVIGETDSVYSGFQIFVKPVMYVVMLFQLSFCVEGIYAAKKSGKIAGICINSFIAIAYLCMPAFLETYYLMSTKLILIPAVLSVYILVFVYYFLRIKQK